MKKFFFVFLLLLYSVLFTGCESSILFWISTGISEPETWYTEYPLESGEYWVYDNNITIRNYEDGDFISTDIISRRDSVVVLGEDTLPNGTQGVHVVDYWSTLDKSGEIHHFYKDMNDGLYCLAVKYEFGMNTYRDPIIPDMSFFVEISPLPGHAIIRRGAYHEDGYTIEYPMRKTLENEYVQEESYWGEAYGDYFDHAVIDDDWVEFRIWEVCVIKKEYYVGSGINFAVEDYLADEGIVRRRINIGNLEVLNEDGTGTGIFRRYDAEMKMVDGTYRH